MAGTKISGLADITTLADGDLIPVVDISDTTQAPTGTTKATTAAVVATSVVTQKTATDAEMKLAAADNVLTTPLKIAVREGAYDIRRAGADLEDPTHDDTDALNDALNVVAFGSGVPSIDLMMPPGVLTLSDTVTVQRKQVNLTGFGRGNPSDYVNPGRSTTMRWTGAADVPMFTFLDGRFGKWNNFYVQGDDTNPPSCFIFFEGGGSIGTNEYFTLEDVLIGYNPWNVGGYGLDRGLWWGGTNTNNDQFVVNRCQIMRVNDAAIQIDNTQSVWGHVVDTIMDANGNGAKGLITHASTTLDNAQFNGCEVDIEVHSTAQVVVNAWNSENSRKLFDIVDGGGRLIVRGGMALLSLIDGDYFGTADVLAGGCVDLEGWKLNTGTASPRPKMSVIGATMAGAVPADSTSTVRVVNCTTTKDDYEISSLANGRVKIHVDDMGIRDDVQLLGVETYVPGLGKSRQTVYDTAATHTHWTKRPSSLVSAHIWVHGPGQGGGSGRRGAVGTVRGGGGGGSPGAIAEALFPAGDLPSAAFSFTIAAAAAGGAAVTADDTNGNPGTIPGNLVVGPLTVVHSSTAAGGGTTSGGTGGTGVANMAGVTGPTGGAGGVGAATPAGTAGTYGASGGGGGAGITAAEAAIAGGAGGATVQRTGYTRTAQSGGTGGVSGGAAPGAGNSPPSTERSGGTGGGGGASHATNAGQAGAAGGMGAGGGGGASSTNGANSGAGGTGGLGKVIITEYHS